MFDDVLIAVRELHALAIKQFAAPGDPTWPLGTLFPQAANRAEADLFKAYFKQARDEMVNRLIPRLFDEDGSKNKWWQVFIFA